MSKLKKYTLNNQPVWRGRLAKYKGCKPKFGVAFTIRPLNRNDVEAMSDLSVEIYDNLRRGEECFIHKHNKDYYRDIFDDKDIRYIGIYVGSRLVGMSYLRVCRTEQMVGEELPNSPVNLFEREGVTKVAALGGDCVLPAFRGNALNRIMIAYRLEMAQGLECTDAVSIVDRNNHWNMPPYFENDFRMFATAIDLADGGKIALMHCDMAHMEPEHRKYGIKVPYQCFDVIDTMLQKGFVGFGYNKETSCVLFAPALPQVTRCATQPVVKFMPSRNEGREYV